MPIQFHPKQGSILICNFEPGFKTPEMVKRRPVVVISPQISVRANLCTVVALSGEEPRVKMPYHHKLDLILPPPWDQGPNWLKGDMLYSVAFHRLELIRAGRDEDNKRIYTRAQLTPEEFREVRKCVLCSLGLSSLTKHLP
jgi:mRNA interferase MazF